MSKISNEAKATRTESTLRRDEVVTNFMGGDSYKVNPLDTLKMISASSIFGERQYYRQSELSHKSTYKVYDGLAEFFMFTDMCGKSTEDMMIEAIDNALSYDFKGTLEWAIQLRNEYYIRLNPNVIMVRAIMHPDRVKFTQENPGFIRECQKKVMFRADDPMSQLAYYLFAYGSKKNMPSILKRSCADKLESLDSYQVNKYKNAEIGMIDSVRICHAHSHVLDKLMTDELTVSQEENTWEMMRSAGKSWAEIFKTIRMGHMALLRNIRNFFEEVDDIDLCREYVERLKSGVQSGKQFPYRYMSAYNAIEGSKTANYKTIAMDALEDCIDISVNNMPHLKGRVAILSDNSGSAWGTLTTEFGTVHVAEIDNLSAVITAACSDYGVVYKFGDRVKKFEISKRTGILKQAKMISNNGDGDVGGATEAGIWIFFRDAMENREHWDSIFIYSDMQAGHGGLYGSGKIANEYKDKYLAVGKHYSSSTAYINVFKLVLDYRKMVNKRVNVFSMQTAGYDNSVLPEYAYRTNILYGWTGKETVFADAMIKQWDAIENRK